MAATASHESMAALARGVLAEGGVRGLFRGLVPAYMRQGPHVLICLPLLEQLRRLLGLDYL